MNLLQVQDARKSFGARHLFDGASFSVNEGDHIGVIGPNGAGKTTLFKILVKQEELDSGKIVRAQALKIGYLEQESDWSLDESSEQYLANNCIKPIWELKQLGLELGLSENHFQSRLRDLSGGYRMRMKLLYLIGQEPNLMLLDEPTNFLDLESILALETFLQSYKGAFLLISHDREFLRRTTDHTLEVEDGDISKFPGNIDDYFEQKAMLREVLEAQSANLEAKRKHLQDFVDRFGAKATKAKQAQSRVKQLAKMESIEIKDVRAQARIHIPDPCHTGKEILKLTGADLGYGDKKILSEINLNIERGDHLGVVGYNGAGKSTLLKSLGSRIPLLRGDYKLGYQVSLSYFAQHVSEDLHADDTVLDSLQRAAHPDVTAQEILNLAGSLLFSGENIKKKVRVLSGGEKSRVALGQVLLKRSPLLLMDEPTNHLDFDTVEAMTQALRNYSGTVIVVSHDRSFIGRVAKKILEIRDGKVSLYPGTYDEYVWSVEKGFLRDGPLADSAKSEPGKKSKDDGGPSTSLGSANSSGRNYREETKKLEANIREYRRKILKCEELIQNQNLKIEELNKELLVSSGIKAAEVAKLLNLAGNEISRLEEDMLAHMEGLEIAETSLKKIREG